MHHEFSMSNWLNKIFYTLYSLVFLLLFLLFFIRVIQFWGLILLLLIVVVFVLFASAFIASATETADLPLEHLAVAGSGFGLGPQDFMGHTWNKMQWVSTISALSRWKIYFWLDLLTYNAIVFQRQKVYYNWPLAFGTMYLWVCAQIMWKKPRQREGNLTKRQSSSTLASNSLTQLIHRVECKRERERE